MGDGEVSRRSLGRVQALPISFAVSKPLPASIAGSQEVGQGGVEEAHFQGLWACLELGVIKKVVGVMGGFFGEQLIRVREKLGSCLLCRTGLLQTPAGRLADPLLH